jgi:hypothetical protein
MRQLQTAFLLLGLAACAAPGVELVPQPGDFAFLEIKLLG